MRDDGFGGSSGIDPGGIQMEFGLLRQLVLRKESYHFCGHTLIHFGRCLTRPTKCHRSKIQAWRLHGDFVVYTVVGLLDFCLILNFLRVVCCLVTGTGVTDFHIRSSSVPFSSTVWIEIQHSFAHLLPDPTYNDTRHNHGTPTTLHHNFNEREALFLV